VVEQPVLVLVVPVLGSVQVAVPMVVAPCVTVKVTVPLGGTASSAVEV